MRIPFAGYADDCTVTGEMGLEADRLSDFLAATHEFTVDGAAFRALDDGRVVQAESAEIRLGDLCVVAATGPRGVPERRLWTRQSPVRVRVGPYTVVGYLHAPPTVDPYRSADRRAILPLTASVVEYAMDGAVVRDHAEAVLVNRLKIERLEPAPASDVELSDALEITMPLDPRSKDMTDEP
jgi:hypothetical protein